MASIPGSGWTVRLPPDTGYRVRTSAVRGTVPDSTPSVRQVVDSILSRPEHAWFEAGAEAESSRIREAMAERYGGVTDAPPRP